jgi:hypothetical protein
MKERKLKMNRKLKRKIKNFVLKFISIICGFNLVICISCIDSTHPNIFYIGIGISLLWLVPFGIANGVFKND